MLFLFRPLETSLIIVKSTFSSTNDQLKPAISVKSPEAASRRCFSKYVFLNFLQYSQGNTCVGVSLYLSVCLCVPLFLCLCLSLSMFSSPYLHFTSPIHACISSLILCFWVFRTSVINYLRVVYF